MASTRAKLVAKKMVGKEGKSLGKMMREVGYSENYADNPQKIMKTKSWQELMDEYIPRELVAKTHKELFEADDIVFVQHKGKIIEKHRPDHTARKGATEMAYKLRGEFAPEKLEYTKRKYQDKSVEELQEIVGKNKKLLFKKEE